MPCHETYRVMPLQTDAESAAIENKFCLAKLQTKWHKSSKHNPENLGLFAYNRAQQSKRYCDRRTRGLEDNVESPHELIALSGQFQSRDRDECTARSLLAGLASKTSTAAAVVEPTKTNKSFTAAGAVETTKTHKPFIAADATPRPGQCHMRKSSIRDASCPYKEPRRTHGKLTGAPTFDF